MTRTDPTPLRAGGHVAGSDAPEKTELRVGYIPLTDCAPVVMAAIKRFDAAHGIRIIPSKEPSWAAVRDKLATGELDAAHVLYGLVYGVHLGIGGPRQDMAVLMTLNQNGQAISLSRLLLEAGVRDGATLVRHVRESASFGLTFAQTFPTGTHAMWLYYWLAAHGIHPLRDVRTVVVPPPDMVDHVRRGGIQGFCAGEPWNQRAIHVGVGFTAATSQSVWPDHPEKVLGTTADWVARHPNAARALTAAVLESCRWIDASPANRHAATAAIAEREFVGVDRQIILGRMLGDYQDGLGNHWKDAHPVRFHGEGAVNFPYLSDGMWFLTQLRRWGLLKTEPDYRAVAEAINRTDIYRDAASATGVALPASPLRSHTLMDGRAWDGSDPAAYAASFEIRGG